MFGVRSLFEEKVLRQYVADARASLLPGFNARVAALHEWNTILRGVRGKAKETTYEQKFNHCVLERVLGFVLFPTQGATAIAKAASRSTGIAGEPDLLLGLDLDREERKFEAVLELKALGVDLDRPQAREGRFTPVEQAFSYGETILGVRWVLVSDMRRIRLYAIDSKHAYHEVDLLDCVRADGHETERFWELLAIFSFERLVQGAQDSAVRRIHGRSLERQTEVRESFYSVYYRIRQDLFEAIGRAAGEKRLAANRSELLLATQRLLDRMLFIYYCEDTPSGLLPTDLSRNTVDGARRLPGRATTKVYTALKDLFRDIDEGSVPSALVEIPRYNGELFKPHPILDVVDLPDSLHDKVYTSTDGTAGTRTVKGVWGLHAFDFWAELNEHLLGHIFEESLSDLVGLEKGGLPSLADKLRERKEHGIFYTSQILADFVCHSSIQALLEERAPLDRAPGSDWTPELRARAECLRRLTVVDLSCGSGAFLVSALHRLLVEFHRVQEAIRESQGAGGAALLALLDARTHSDVLKGSLYGIDLLPQAAEIAKLALWLRSARKGEPVPDLGENIGAGDALDVRATLARLPEGGVDLVVGNPPWGATVDPAVVRRACADLGVEGGEWDSWELFVLLSLRALRPGGRLALVLPDTVFSPAKARVRRALFEQTRVEKVYNLGADWFGPSVRMGTVLVQARKGEAPSVSDLRAVLLTGELRRLAIKGAVQLSQVEAELALPVPQERCAAHPTCDVEVFRSRRDDHIMAHMETNGVPLGELCERDRGEEFSKGGTFWVCASCGLCSVPGRKQKGGGYAPKACPHCGHTLRPDEVRLRSLVTESPQPASVPFVDGDDIASRYGELIPGGWLATAVPGVEYKDALRYRSPKILIRQAGVGINAALDLLSARCPQSIYIYRIRDELVQAGYRHEFLLGALLSRTFTYYVFKRFGEVDPARAHAKLTHERLHALPVPKVDFSNPHCRQLHDEIVAAVRRLLGGESAVGGEDDLAIERDLRALWGVSAEEGAFINGEFSQVPQGQVVRELFPHGAPRAARRQ